MIVLILVAAMFAAAYGVVWMLARFGKDALAGRQSIGWVRGKNWRW